MISVVDCGIGNMGSIFSMLKRVGASFQVCSSAKELEKATKIILPGVGAFDPAMEKINSSGFREALDRKALVEKVPILGICLGMQLLTNSSEEGTLPGLGWVPAKTLAFRGRIGDGLKIPHMGWNVVQPQRPNPLLAGFSEFGEIRFYFVHSYFVTCEHAENSILKTDYGLEFDAAVWKGNIYGVQFHPEKSHKFGMRLFQNFNAL